MILRDGAVAFRHPTRLFEVEPEVLPRQTGQVGTNNRAREGRRRVVAADDQQRDAVGQCRAGVRQQLRQRLIVHQLLEIVEHQNGEARTTLQERREEATCEPAQIRKVLRGQRGKPGAEIP
jgi:hypothetical protein